MIHEESPPGAIDHSIPDEGRGVGRLRGDVRVRRAAGAKVSAAHGLDAGEETIDGLEGILVRPLNRKRSGLAPGQTLCSPRGTVRRFDNISAAGAKALAVITPAILGPDYFRETVAVLKAAADGPPDPAAIAEAMMRHGLTPAT